MWTQQIENVNSNRFCAALHLLGQMKVPFLAPVASVKGMTSDGHRFYASTRESHKVRSHVTHGL